METIVQVCLFFYIIGKEIMENSGCYWDTDEDKQLIKLYSKYKKDPSGRPKGNKKRKR
jgi:hypothetical protein